MTLIDSLGDEFSISFHSLITLFIAGIVYCAWWSTNINEQRHIRTVLLLERTIRHRFHRRLTNHTETITISEGTNNPSPLSEEVSPADLSPSTDPSSDSQKPPEASTSSSTNPELDVSEDSETIINTMDADTCVMRQRRIVVNEEATTSGSSTTQHSGESSVKEMGDNDINKDKSGLTIKLKYINDDIKIVEANFAESLEDFKKRHFEQELSANKLIRLIFNGQVLQPDTQTLKSCGLFHNCVVHCLIHPRRQTAADPDIVESRSEGYSFPQAPPASNQNREWDLGNFLFLFISMTLLAAWYFRYVYAHLYTLTATVGLILITGIFTIVLVGMYFPENENFPNPTIHIRERVTTTMVPTRQ